MKLAYVFLVCIATAIFAQTVHAAELENETPAKIDQKDYVAGKMTLLNDNGGWCWYQDERVVFDPANQTLLIGSVATKQGKGGDARDGNIECTAYNLADNTSKLFTFHEHLQTDDHNAPAFLIRPDGRYLAMYTKHTTDKVTRWRVSKNPHDATAWEDEKTFDWTQPPANIGENTSTYSNIFYQPTERRTYDFVRSVNKDPSCLVSMDDGSTWKFGGKLLTDTNVGYVDGYVKYAQNGPDRIDFITTEHHPRDFNNSIYHGYVKNGKICRSDGTVLKENILDGDSKAPRANELTTVLGAETVINGEKMTHCWDADLAIDPEGNPYCLLTCRANDVPENSNFNDHRFFYARFDGKAWHTHQLAKAGARLWNSEEDYIGGGCVDPQNKNVVYISTAIDPRNEKKLAKHELFKGTTADGGSTWNWTPITLNSSVDNMRPIVPLWKTADAPLLWLRGSMSRSQIYNMQVVAILPGK
jgi:hypothetical protein